MMIWHYPGSDSMWLYRGTAEVATQLLEDG
jgi:hypothetical protein